MADKNKSQKCKLILMNLISLRRLKQKKQVVRLKRLKTGNIKGIPVIAS